MSYEVRETNSLEFVASKFQKPLYVVEKGEVVRRQIGLTNIFATHGMSVGAMAAVAQNGEFATYDPDLEGKFFITPNPRNKYWKRSPQSLRLGQLAGSAYLSSSDPMRASELYADTHDEEGRDGGFIVAFKSTVIAPDDAVEYAWDSANGFPEIVLSRPPKLDSIFKIIPLDQHSVKEYEAAVDVRQ